MGGRGADIIQRSLSLLRPTIRKEGSELWANWNPRRKKDAIDEFLRQTMAAGSVLTASQLCVRCPV